MPAATASVLLVDDDRGILESLEPTLAHAGYSVRCARTADQAFAHMNGGVVDLVILDVELPGLSGIELLKIVRRHPKFSRVPVLMLTMHGRDSEKVTGLRTGADDYLVKPFSLKELMARVEALLRRSRHDGRPQSVLEAGGIRIDMDSREITSHDDPVELTPMEFALLTRFIERKGLVFTYQALSETLSEGARIMTSDNVHAHVKNLRRKLGKSGELIENVHGIGYKFTGV